MAIVERARMTLQFARTGLGIRDKAVCGLLGIATPAAFCARHPWWGWPVPKVLKVTPARLRGLSLLIDPHDWSQTIIYREVFVAAAYDLSRVCFEPEQVVDCGGHIGMFSLLAAAAFPRARVTVFEPNANNFARLRENCALNDLQWDCRLAAVGAAAGDAYLEVVNSHSAHLSSERGVPTKIFRLRDFISALGPCNLVLKIDVEGEERAMWPELIPGLPEQAVVFFETHHGGDGWSCAESRFSQYGFEVFKLVDRGAFCDGYARRLARSP